MSQANRPGSPRQKMINLMYIVLLALLALNVSSDVLDSFTQVWSAPEKVMKAAMQPCMQLLSSRPSSIRPKPPTRRKKQPMCGGGARS